MKKLISILIAGLLIVSMLPICVSAETRNKSWTWKINGDYVLTISGNGAIPDYGGPSPYNNTSPWYEWRMQIKKIIIENGITKIGYAAFKDFTEVTDVTISDSVKVIGSCSFEGCVKLSNITIPNSVTSLGGASFRKCESLTSITIPDSIVKLQNGTFWACSNLTNVKFDDNSKIDIIDDYAFRDCVNLKRINLPDSLTSIGVSAFENCYSLTNIVFPIGIDTIRNKAFYNCKEMDELAIPETIINIGEEAFVGTKYYSNKDNWDDAALYISNCLIYCSTFTEKYSVKSGTRCIADSAFSNCRNLTDIDLPNSVNSLSFGSFSYCRKLKRINIPDNITYIGDQAFSYCNNLQEVHIDNLEKWCNIYFVGMWSNPLELSHNLYLKNELITRLVIPDEISIIKGDTFKGGSCFTEVVFHDNVKAIYSGAFSGCTGLTNVKIPNSVTTIGWHVFSGCTSLTNIILPNDISEIPYNLFKNCSALKNITVPNSVTSIKNWAFYGCIGLTNIDIPNNVTQIDDCAFENCTNLTIETVKNSAADSYAKRKNIPVVYYDQHTHKWNSEYTIDVQPTCITPGSKSIHCSICDMQKDFVEIDATGHDYVNHQCQNCKEFSPLIVFKDYDGAVLSSEYYYLGDSITEPNAPSREADNACTYTFIGWDKEVVACEGDAVYTAVYRATPIEYTVIFKNYDGSELLRNTYHYGDAVVPPSDIPEKPADSRYKYIFAGWDSAVGSCDGDKVYTAVFTSEFIEYTVIFKNYDGSIISTKTYHYGDTVQTPVEPTKQSDLTYTYAFAGWDKKVTAVTGNAVYTATYTATYIDYTVTFKDWNGTVLSAKIYQYGDKVTAPGDPTRAADKTYTYTFAGWDKAVVNCAGNVTYTATYTNKYIDYTVIFRYEDGTVIKQYTLHYGESVTVPANPAVPAVLGSNYEFSRWDKDVIATCQGNTMYTAVFVRKYIIGDLDGDGVIDIRDLISLKKYFAKQSEAVVPQECLDVSGDGEINSYDLVALRQKLLFQLG